MCFNLFRGGLTLMVAAVLMPRLMMAQATPAQAQQPSTGTYQPGAAFPETYQQGGYFYPGVEFRALPGFRSASAFYWSQFRRAEQNLSLLVNDAARTYHRSGDFMKAKAEEQAAWESLNAIRADALSGVRQDPSYKASIDLQVKLQNQIREARESDGPLLGRVLALATLKLTYAANSSAMESAAVEADPKMKQAHQRLVDAAARVAEVRQQYEETVRADPQIVLARRALEDARTQALAASVQYLEADRIAGVGLDFAYHLNQSTNNYGYGGGYGYGGYGYGYGGLGGFQVGYPTLGR